MNLTNTIIIIVLMLGIGGEGYLIYGKYTDQKNANSQTNSTQSSTTNQTVDACADFTTRFEISPEELMTFINSEPDATSVLMGYRYIAGEIILTENKEKLPFMLTIDSSGKVTSAECSLPTQKLDDLQDFSYVIPEADFANIITNRNTLQSAQVEQYFANFSTTPASAKQTMIKKIQGM